MQHEPTHVPPFALTGCPSNDACPEWFGVWFRGAKTSAGEDAANESF